jgi:acyl carrier protein
MNIEAARVLIADHLAVAVEDVRDDAVFSKDLGADSLDMIELAMRFERALDISIPDDEGVACATVRDALNVLQRKIARSKGAATPNESSQPLIAASMTKRRHVR